MYLFKKKKSKVVEIVLTKIYNRHIAIEQYQYLVWLILFQSNFFFPFF